MASNQALACSPLFKKSRKSTCAICIAASRCRKCGKAMSEGGIDINQMVPDLLGQLPPLPNPLLTKHPDFVIHFPPEPPNYGRLSVFLGGSIEMGNAIPWQENLTARFSHLPITICNPRRGKWDDSITPEAKDEEFRRQVEWELSALENATVVLFFFDSGTLSPVTMMELGLCAKTHKNNVFVRCSREFWKGGNVHIVCEKYGIPCVDTFEELVHLIKDKLKEKGMRLDENGNLIA